jgi:predicted NUDIX family NTP pyrophosphohydrolase
MRSKAAAFPLRLSSDPLINPEREKPMLKRSAGIVLYRRQNGQLEVFLVHPGGPFWKSKDRGAWSIPKGEYGSDEDPFAAARREFEEETAVRLPQGEAKPLGEIKQAGGKIVTAWALEGDCAAGEIRSNLFSLEWPPKSGNIQGFPEVDRAGWFDLTEARDKLLPSQLGFLERLEKAVGGPEGEPAGGT